MAEESESTLVVKTDVQVSPQTGWKSSEFWITMIGTIIGALLTTGIIAPGTKWDKLAGVAMIVLTQLGYTASRTLVKRATLHSLGDPAAKAVDGAVTRTGSQI